MANISKEQRETLALIDAIMSMMENRDTFDELHINASLSLNPFDFLFMIIEKYTTYEEIVNWLAKFLTVSIPVIELSLKGLLLSNLKSMADCNVDPRIPNYMRKPLYSRTEGSDITKDDGIGLLFNLKGIDYSNMMSISPISKMGGDFYFGTRKLFYIDYDHEDVKDKKFYTYKDARKKCEKLGISTYYIKDKSEISSIHELVRARDMNAFLWYASHKSQTPKITTISTPLNAYSHTYHEMGDKGEELQHTVTPFADCESKTLLERVDGYVRLDSNVKTPPFVPGNVATHVTNGSLNYAMCVSSYTPTSDVTILKPPMFGYDKTKYGFEDEITVQKAPRDYTFTFVPYSDDGSSMNWYVNSKTYYDFLKKPEDREPRNLDEEKGICNFKYINGRLKFTILPKPLVHIPRELDKNWKFTTIRFNSRGVPDADGKYSCKLSNPNNNNNVFKVIKDGDGIISYRYELVEGYYLLVLPSGEYYLFDGTNKISEDYTPDNLYSVLYECYPKLTVYEFNYDYIMSQQLFDAKVIAGKLINSLYALRYSSSANIDYVFKSNKSETAYQMRIAEIVKNIVESTAYEVSDCFYTFSNDRYDEMLNESELKRSQNYQFNKNGATSDSLDGDAFKDILNEFSSDATLEENIDTFKRAFNQVTADITQEILPEDTYSFVDGFDKSIILNALKTLTSCLVESLITPKIVLLFEINRKLMGGEGEILDIEEWLKLMTNLIVGIVRELRDLILQELINWVMKFLGELISILADEIIREQLEYYSKLMKLLWKACAFKASHRANLDSELDHVDYADIDEIEKPLEDKC